MHARNFGLLSGKEKEINCLIEFKVTEQTQDILHVTSFVRNLIETRFVAQVILFAPMKFTRFSTLALVKRVLNESEIVLIKSLRSNIQRVIRVVKLKMCKILTTEKLSKHVNKPFSTFISKKPVNCWHSIYLIIDIPKLHIISLS